MKQTNDHPNPNKRKKETNTYGSPGTGSGKGCLCLEVKHTMSLSCMFVNIWKDRFHCITATPPVTRHRQLFLTVAAEVMPTSVFPAPQGRTIMPGINHHATDGWLVKIGWDGVG